MFLQQPTDPFGGRVLVMGRIFAQQLEDDLGSFGQSTDDVRECAAAVDREMEFAIVTAHAVIIVGHGANLMYLKKKKY